MEVISPFAVFGARIFRVTKAIPKGIFPIAHKSMIQHVLNDYLAVCINL